MNDRKTLSILIVDDEAELRHSVCSVIKENLLQPVIIKEAEEIPWIVFDLEKIRYLYSAALGYIAFLKKSLQEKGTELCLINTNDDLTDLFNTVGFDNIVQIFNDEKTFLNEAKLY